jgi:Fe2+ or Zn2+ uptake regulation protein
MTHTEDRESTPTFAECIITLCDAGIRLTSQRRTILKWASQMADGFTIPQAVQALSTRGIGQATVYRTLGMLGELGLLREIVRAGTRQKRLRITSPRHHHAIVCDSCGKVEEFDTCGWALLSQLLKLQTGFQIRDHYLEVHGTCRKCQRAS